jgi:hypothetical protein
MYILGGTNDRVFQYTLTTAWDITSLGGFSSELLTLESGGFSSVCFKPDGTVIYIAYNTGSPSFNARRISQIGVRISYSNDDNDYWLDLASTSSVTNQIQNLTLSYDGNYLIVISSSNTFDARYGTYVNEYKKIAGVWTYTQTIIKHTLFGQAGGLNCVVNISSDYSQLRIYNPNSLFNGASSTGRTYVFTNATPSTAGSWLLSEIIDGNSTTPAATEIISSDLLYKGDIANDVVYKYIDDAWVWEYTFSDASLLTFNGDVDEAIIRKSTSTNQFFSCPRVLDLGSYNSSTGVLTIVGPKELLNRQLESLSTTTATETTWDLTLTYVITTATSGTETRTQTISKED